MVRICNPRHFKTNPKQHTVLAAIRQAGSSGATCFEVEQGTGLPHQTASARIRELAQAGRIQWSGTKRPTWSGRQAKVWVELL